MFPPSSEMKPKALPEGTSSGFCSMNSDCGRKYADYEVSENRYTFSRVPKCRDGSLVFVKRDGET